MEEADGVGELVFDDHASGVPVDELCGRDLHLSGDKQRRLVVPQVGDGNLAEGLLVAADADLFFQDARGTEGASHIGEADALPLAPGPFLQGSHHLARTSGQGKEGDAALGQRL